MWEAISDGRRVIEYSLFVAQGLSRTNRDCPAIRGVATADPGLLTAIFAALR